LFELLLIRSFRWRLCKPVRFPVTTSGIMLPTKPSLNTMKIWNILQVIFPPVCYVYTWRCVWVNASKCTISTAWFETFQPLRFHHCTKSLMLWY
jgi:hypothetical protein